MGEKEEEGTGEGGRRGIGEKGWGRKRDRGNVG
jgi:hypothetical protein